MGSLPDKLLNKMLLNEKILGVKEKMLSVMSENDGGDGRKNLLMEIFHRSFYMDLKFMNNKAKEVIELSNTLKEADNLARKKNGN